jgi:hypothetical protein
MKQRLLALIIGFILSLVVGTIMANAQDKQAETGKDCIDAHPTKKDLYDSLRILPAKIISRDQTNNLLYWKFEDKATLHLGSFKLIPEGEYSPNYFAGNDVYIILFCQSHLVAWQILKFNPRKIK